MPIYEFECVECRYTQKLCTSSINVPVPQPPTCGSCGLKGFKRLMQRIWTPVGFSIGGYNSKNGYSKDENGWGEKRVVR